MDETRPPSLPSPRGLPSPEEELHHLKAVLENLAEGVIALDSAGCLRLANRKARQIFDLGGRDCVGKPMAAFVPREELLNALQNPDGEAPRQVEIDLRPGRVYSARVTPLPSGGTTITLVDISHFKEIDRIKSEFVNTISHDLRSPLTAILGYIELIERAGEINRKQKDFIRRVQMSVHNITDLINDLLDLGQIEAGLDQHKESVSIPTIVQMAVESYHLVMEQKKQELVLELPQELPVVRGNALRLRQMLQNLIDNATKYSPEGSRIVIRATAQEGQLILQVEDNGLGIPLTDHPYIFVKLYRGSNISPQIPGSGLGLTIVKSIVESHGGRYWFESSEGEGSTFTVVLPVAGPPPR
jgi:two-component system NtrC family sensor kinase